MRYLGLDIGSKRIGVAISDPMHLTAQSLTVIHRSSIEKDIESILEIVNQQEVETIVCGLPKNMNGTIGEQAKYVMKLIERIRRKTNIPILTWDERLSSKAAEDLMISGNVRRDDRKKKIDQVAAAIILQNFLDSRRRNCSDK